MGKYGFVYIWYDRKHKRYYVGCHWGDINDGYICSSPWMLQAYKHRPQDFKRRILKTNIPTRPELYNEELRYLQMIKESEIRVRYYNLNIRNNEAWHKYPEHIKTVGEKISASPLRNQRISEALRGRKLSERHITATKLGLKNYYQSHSGNQLGRKHSEDSKRKMSISHSNMSEETKKKIGKASSGRKWSQDQHQKVRLTIINTPQEIKQARNKKISDHMINNITDRHKNFGKNWWTAATNEQKLARNAKIAEKLKGNQNKRKPEVL